MDSVVNKITREPLWSEERRQIIKHINLQLAALGQPIYRGNDDDDYLGIAGDLLRNYQQQKKLLADYRCPVDLRIQNFLNDYLRKNGIEQSVSLPGTTLVLAVRDLDLEPARDPRFPVRLAQPGRLLRRTHRLRGENGPARVSHRWHTRAACHRG